MSTPRIKVVCFFYNEEVLAQFFVQHYRWADCIHAVVSRSADRTREALAAAHNVQIEDFEFPAGMDDFLKRDKVNQIISAPSEFDWLMVVDADEFIWPAPPARGRETGGQLTLRIIGGTVREYLAEVPAQLDVIPARMRNVFRHETDGDLDLMIGPALQRRHGDPDYGSPGNAQYTKPIVIRANRGVHLGLGNHECSLPGRHISATHWFEGTHWQNADPSFCLARRIRDRRDRQSAANRQYGLGAQHHHITEADVLALCAAHRRDPKLF